MTSRTGSITRDGDLATITFERRLPHAIEAVWAAITDPDQRAKWFGDNINNSGMSTRLYRFLEMVRIRDLAAGMSSQSRVPGMINLNAVWEPEVMQALLDHPQAATIFQQMLARRGETARPAVDGPPLPAVARPPPIVSAAPALDPPATMTYFPASEQPEQGAIAVSVPVVAIVGRPNVGKSSLFNWLAGRRIAIVDPTAGVTRDRVSAPVPVGDRRVELVDTGGIGIEDVDDLTEHVERQIQTAQGSDIAVSGNPAGAASRGLGYRSAGMTAAAFGSRLAEIRGGDDGFFPRHDAVDGG